MQGGLHFSPRFVSFRPLDYVDFRLLFVTSNARLRTRLALSRRNSIFEL
jgi:hypothetical protein